MWTKKTKSGKVRYCERYEDYLTGKKKDISVLFEKDNARNRREAAAMLQKKITEKAAPLKEGLTFARLIDEYRADQRLTVRSSTYDRNYFALESIKKMIGPDILVERLNARYVQAAFLSSKRSPGTLNEFMSRFKALIRWGYKVELIENIEYLNRLTRFKDVSHKEKISLKYLESDELHILLDAMENRKWALFTEFLALSGLRCGEAIALEKKDVDLDNRVIRVTKTYNSTAKEVCPAKTINSIDDVYIQKELARVICEIQDLTRRREFIGAFRGTLFFPGDRGDYLNYFSYNKYFKKMTAAIVGRKLTTHSLRHTHASLLFEQGFTLDEVSRRLRHGNSKVTKEVYIHVTQKLREKDAEKLDLIELLK